MEAVYASEPRERSMVRHSATLRLQLGNPLTPASGPCMLTNECTGGSLNRCT